ncbi:hypothetical protein KC351_g3756 [Hortaea werneckii]|nr:hypothetical protein KC351_g3756 [Hortaea werneckii]
MPTALKRKGSPGLTEGADPSKRRFAEEEVAPQTSATTTTAPSASETAPPTDSSTATTPAAQTSETAAAPPLPNGRAARFAALRARNQASRKENLKETKSEASRAATDPSALHSLNRKRDIASHKLLKAETESRGEDFERKRAWDWTAEESERWDAKMAEKQRKRDQAGFSDYSAEAGKIYERQVGQNLEEKAEGFGERKEAYEREKAEALDRAVRSGGLGIVETPSGELIAVDKDGTFYSTADGTQHVQNRPSKDAVDRLVADIKKAEEVRLKKRKDRGKDDESERDITYINEKNKQFNMKLARFYNKYTADIRDSFERGTAI